MAEVTITPREIFDLLQRIHSEMIMIRRDLDVLMSRDSDHESRLRSLERRLWPLPTVSVLVSLCAFALSVIVWLV